MSEVPFRINKLAIKNIEIHVGDIDPSVIGFQAPLRSIYFSNIINSWWRKTGVTDTDWTIQGTGNSNVSGEKLEISINQVSHGFIVGDILRKNGLGYVKAKADSIINSNVIGIVSEITDTDNFKMILSGYINTLSGLTNGTQYYLSDSTEGLFTSSSLGIYQKPLFTAVSATQAFVNIGISSFGSLISNNEYLISNNGILNISQNNGKWEFLIKGNTFSGGNFVYSAGDTDLLIKLNEPISETMISNEKDKIGYINIYVESATVYIQNLSGSSKIMFIKKLY